MEEITIRIDLDVGHEDACENCERELKELIDKGILVNIGEGSTSDLYIPEGFSLIIVPDYNSAKVLTHYHIELIDRKFFRKFPHPMQWKCPECGELFKTKGRFKKHLAKEYKMPVESIAMIDDALMQKK